MQWRFPSCAAAFAVLMLHPAAAGDIADDHGHDDDATVFFGMVKDTRGSAIAEAIVSINQKNMSFITRTDVLGGYRFVTTMDGDEAQLACRKDGYSQAGTTRRTAPGVKSPIEIDCTLQRAR